MGRKTGAGRGEREIMEEEGEVELEVGRDEGGLGEQETSTCKGGRGRR